MYSYNSEQELKEDQVNIWVTTCTDDTGTLISIAAWDPMIILSIAS